AVGLHVVPQDAAGDLHSKQIGDQSSKCRKCAVGTNGWFDADPSLSRIERAGACASADAGEVGLGNGANKKISHLVLVVGNEVTIQTGKDHNVAVSAD